MSRNARETDRRITRTRRLLREALVSLILERGWDGFGVQDICTRADVGRSTFYTHFADKEELLAGAFDDVRKGIRRPATADGAIGIVRGILDHAARDRRLFRALVGKKSSPVVRERFRAHVVEAMRDELGNDLPPGAEGEPTVRFLAGAFLELLTWWIEGRSGLTAETLEERYRALANGVLNFSCIRSRGE